MGLFQTKALFFEIPKHLFDPEPAAVTLQIVFARSEGRQQIPGFVLGIEAAPTTVEAQTQTRQPYQADIVFKIDRATAQGDLPDLKTDARLPSDTRCLSSYGSQRTSPVGPESRNRPTLPYSRSAISTTGCLAGSNLALLSITWFAPQPHYSLREEASCQRIGIARFRKARATKSKGNRSSRSV